MTDLGDVTGNSRWLYLATNLDFFGGEEAGLGAETISVGGRLYYRVTPAVYAWFKLRMERARKAVESGDNPALAALLPRWEAVREWAIKNLDADATRAALRNPRPLPTAPPEPPAVASCGRCFAPCEFGENGHPPLPEGPRLRYTE